MLGVFLPVWKSSPLSQFPKHTKHTLKLNTFLCGPLFLLDQGAATEEEGNAFRVSLTPQRPCTTHGLPSLPLKWIRATLNIKIHPDSSSFSRPSVQLLPPGEAHSRAELWEYKISCYWCLVNQHPIPRKGTMHNHVPATCTALLSHLERGSQAPRELHSPHF